ncbi:uncharacterized protein LOC116012871 [Ipomoea triloba]|uniref:uncharacterized protein LOC116012871 n=1 Tax=Ipomoea triloba TaxID=35885 RepID=UPI00125D218B|nr:uncharacterized protein LOC116012871 [Ipomoea triloba]
MAQIEHKLTLVRNASLPTAGSSESQASHEELLEQVVWAEDAARRATNEAVEARAKAAGARAEVAELRAELQAFQNSNELRQDVIKALLDDLSNQVPAQLQSLFEAIQVAEERQQTDQFAKWIADIGDGVSSECTNEEDDLIIPNHILLQYIDNPIAAMVESTFLNYETACTDSQFLHSRAILAPTLDVVDGINDYMNEMNNGDSKTYLSCDTVCKAYDSADTLGDLHTPEFLNGLRCSGIPNHFLTIKVGSPVMLLRNIDHSLGLCNGTRLIVTRLVDHVLEAKIMSGTHEETKVLIPRMSLTPSDTRLPFKFQRKQFPLMLLYAMTINKSQVSQTSFAETSQDRLHRNQSTELVSAKPVQYFPVRRIKEAEKKEEADERGYTMRKRKSPQKKRKSFSGKKCFVFF